MVCWMVASLAGSLAGWLVSRRIRERMDTLFMRWMEYDDDIDAMR